MSDTKAANPEGQIHSQQVAPSEYPPAYHDATRAHAMNYPMPGAPGSQYPHLPPPGTDIPMQPLAQPAYNPNVAHYGPSQPPYPNQYPMQAPPASSPYNNIGFTNPQQPPAPIMSPAGLPNPSAEYNYPKNYVAVPPDNQNDRRQSDDMDCCKCLLCCCGCIELCRCFGMCLKCICDTDD